MWFRHDRDAERLDAANLRHQIRARQPVGGNAEVQHAAGDRARVVHLHAVPEPGQMVRGREAARPRPDDQHALAGRRRVDRERPALGPGEVAEEPLDGVNADRRVQLAAVAVGLARVVADPPVHRGQRIIPDQRLPRLAVLARLRQREPRLDVLAGRTRVAARRQERHVLGTPLPDGPAAQLVRQVDDRGHVVRPPRHAHSSPARRP